MTTTSYFEMSSTLAESPLQSARIAIPPPPDWLYTAVDPAWLAAALNAAEPVFASGAMTLIDCRMLRLRLKDTSGQWNGIYSIVVQDAVKSPPVTMQLAATLVAPSVPGRPDAPEVQGTFGSDDWSCWLPDMRVEFRPQPPDTVLAALPVLVDSVRARDFLEESIRTNPRYHDLRIASCTPRVTRYKPGSRCTVLYDLTYAPEDADRGWPHIVVAKTYHGNKGLIAYESMQVLWESPLASNDLVSIAEPLAYLPDMKVLIQGPIAEEQTLEDLFKRAIADEAPEINIQLDRMLERTAAGLAALHASEARYDEVVTWKDELKDVRKLIKRLSTPIPELVPILEPFLEQLVARAAVVPEDETLPAHHSFRPAQVLIHQDQIGFIDFDGFCQAEPAMDIALFRTTLLDNGTRDLEGAIGAERLARFERLDAMNERFLQAYEALRPVRRERIALWETLFNLTNLLGCWTKARPAEFDHTLAILERQLQRADL